MTLTPGGFVPGYAAGMAAAVVLALVCITGAAHAETAERPFAVNPYGWVSGGFAWKQDDPSLAAPADGFVATARLGIEAAAEPIQLRARIEVDLLPAPVLQDAFLNWSPHPAFSLNVGQLKVPFSISQLASDTRRQLPSENAVQALSGIGRDIGVSVEGRLPIGGQSRASLSSAMMNGEGKNRVENGDETFLFAQRLLITPFGQRERPAEGKSAQPYLGFGGGWVHNGGVGADASLRTDVLAAELQLAFGIISLQSEFMDLTEAGTDPRHASATYGQLGFFVPAPWAIQHVELVGRAGYAEPDDAGSGSGQVAALDIDAGVNLYVPETPAYLHDVKLGLAFRHSIEDEGAEIDNDRFDALATVRF